MATLKSLKLRIASVKSTQKITKAMKMVAAAKLRRAQEAAEAGRPYASRIEAVVASLGARVTPGPQTSKMLTGSGKEDTYLLVVCTSDRGLAGAFNANIVKAARQRALALIAAGKTVKFYLVGKKGGAVIRRLFPGTIIASTEFAGVKQIGFEHAAPIADDIAARYEAGEFDVAYLYYAKFQSALVQEPTEQQILPVPVQAGGGEAAAGVSAAVEYEPDEEGILADLLPRNLSVQLFRALLENAASEQGSRMTAMDNATRNAGDMINRLSIQYNRQRQAAITTELVEIISGAEAL
ncbi:F0F1 ATP synthase subunit gamma [Sphingosinicella microcystinivorans]|uniref:ATP synthase gamma chain n=1 Tax=Sphingosinicella microcystinivorans TaxID=335406 RepID=A0AAD1D4V5_SPHMI|nr:F0F1 ATP synthase subunit gamma [Sphingosinicella microcystinivorans]RKS90942.1 ATP synthase F1 subcomplex gamma subunit [Sphingosinicella microcystinivorans]BBE33861.1 ATP synthase gamma chain [Sphingosinicella microcystinivorans]